MKEAPLERIEDLLSRLLDRVTPLSGEVVDIDLMSVEDLLGRVLASPVRAAVSHPPSDVSAMDGWAIRSADIERASGPEPVVLACVGGAAGG
ncbi:MAG: molybdopterin molybdenumtransferase MoeA, partial [Candidatus Limnocylindrus sp.]